MEKKWLYGKSFLFKLQLHKKKDNQNINNSNKKLRVQLRDILTAC